MTIAEQLRELAEDYLHLAQDADGNVDAPRRRRYEWLVKLSEQPSIGAVVKVKTSQERGEVQDVALCVCVRLVSNADIWFLPKELVPVAGSSDELKGKARKKFTGEFGKTFGKTSEALTGPAATQKVKPPKK